MGDNTTYITSTKPTYTITHEDGSAVTPQEVYDAFMSGPVILENLGDGVGYVETVLGMEYAGTPDNVTRCGFFTHNNNYVVSG